MRAEGSGWPWGLAGEPADSLKREAVRAMTPVEGNLGSKGGTAPSRIRMRFSGASDMEDGIFVETEV